ncbi:hypothetical protein MBLNU459_g0167t1 [Dothideomycetes sp. NU459]
MYSRALLVRALVRRSRQPCARPLPTLARAAVQPSLQTRLASHTPPFARWMSSKSIADEKVEEITELYATARDEFEIAAEETEKQTVYAEEDRKAAREELTRVQQAYAECLDGPDKDLAEEVKKRVGHRIRELENAVIAMEELAMNQD